MNDKLHIIQHLYGEADASSDREHLLEDEALRAEYETLSGVKFHLDQRPKQRPDAAVLDNVFAAAAKASGQPALHARQDRKPQPRHAARRYGLFGTVSAVVALLIVAGVGLFQMQQKGLMQTEPPASAIPDEAEAMTDQAAPLAEQIESKSANDANEPLQATRAESARSQENRSDAMASAPLGRVAQPESVAPAPLDASAEASGLAFAKAEADAVLADDAEAEEAVPAWDASDEVLRVHRQLEMVETRSPAFAWGDSSVISLDALPTNLPGRDTVTPVNTRRGNH